MCLRDAYPSISFGESYTSRNVFLWYEAVFILLQSTMDDYDDMPISKFGMAMLRGMGWKHGEAIGLNKKGSVSGTPTHCTCTLNLLQGLS